MRFASTLHQAVSPPLPIRETRRATDRLISEIGRSVGPAYLPRLEALALLRTSVYDDVVLEAVLDQVLRPDSQTVLDVMSVLGNRPDPALLDTMCQLLAHPRSPVAAGAAYCIATMLRSARGLRPEALRDAAPAILDAFAASDGDELRHTVLAALLRQLPPAFQQLAEHRGLSLTPGDRPAVTAWSSSVHRLAVDLGVAVMHRLDARPEPLLARTIYEALVDPVSTRGQWAKLLLMVLPYADVVAETLLEESGKHEGALRDTVSTLLAHVARTRLPAVDAWLSSEDDAVVRPALVHLAHTADKVDADLLRALIDDPTRVETRPRVLYAAGMTGSPALRGWADDPALDDEVRDTAAWWVENGTRITEI